MRKLFGSLFAVALCCGAADVPAVEEEEMSMVFEITGDEEDAIALEDMISEETTEVASNLIYADCGCSKGKGKGRGK